MPARKPASTPKVESTGDDFDALLATSENDSGNVPETPADVSIEDLVANVEDGPRTAPIPELTPAQARLAAARAAAAELERLKSEAAKPEPDDYDEFAGLTEDEIREMKALEDKLAVETAELIEKAPDRFDNSQRGGNGEKILFHVVRDGFTAFGQVWLRGQEIEVEKGTPAYKRTLNANGETWLDIIDKPHAQLIKWKRHYVASGPFVPNPGEKFDDAVAKADLRRGRSVPIVIGD